MNPTSIHEDTGSISALPEWVKGSDIAMSCRVSRGCGSDPILLGLWCRPAAAALIQLSWLRNFICHGCGPKKTKKKKKKKKKVYNKIGGFHTLGKSETNVRALG